MRLFQKGVSLTEVNLSVVLATFLIVPFIAFYGTLQQTFLTSYHSISYLNKTDSIGKDLVDDFRRTMAPAADTVALDFPVAPAGLVDYTLPTDKQVRIRRGTNDYVHYVYDEANEQVWMARNNSNAVPALSAYRALNLPGQIKAFALRYYDKQGVWSDVASATANSITPVVGLTAGEWVGYQLLITIGTGARQAIVTVTGNTATTLSVAPNFTTIPDATSKFTLYKHSDVPQTPTPLTNPTNVRRTSVGMVALPIQQFRIDKGAGFHCGEKSANAAVNTTPPYRSCEMEKNDSNLSVLNGGVVSATATTLTIATNLNVSGYLDPADPARWIGAMVAITSGKGRGQKVSVTATTPTVLTVAPSFTVLPDATSQFRLYYSDFEGVAENGTSLGLASASGVTTGTLVDAQKNWHDNEWIGNYVMLTAGPGAGQMAKIVGNTATTLHVMDIFRNDAIYEETTRLEFHTSATQTAAQTSWLVAPSQSRYLILPRFYRAEEGVTTVAGTTTSLVDSTKSDLWRSTAYPMKNRGVSVPVSGIYSSYFQGFSLEILSGALAGQVRVVLSNTTSQLDVYPNEPFTAAVPINTRYRLIRFGRSADADVPESSQGTAAARHYLLTDMGIMCNAVDPCPAPADNTRLDDLTKNWKNNYWRGGQMVVRPAQGDNGGKFAWITSNTATTLFFSPGLTSGASSTPLLKLDRYLLLPPDNMPVMAATATTLTITPPPVGGAYPTNMWKNGYIEIFDPSDYENTHKVRKITSSSGNVMTVGEAMSPVPTANYRYRLFHKPEVSVPFTWAGDAYLRQAGENKVYN